MKISKDKSYEIHLNKHNVIWIDLTGIYCSIRDKNDFLKEFEETVLDDLKDSYENILTDYEDTIVKCLKKIKSITGERFIILIDEWDLIFREQEENRELGYTYLKFLNQTFTSSDVSDCIELVYMTGIYPIKRNTDKSTLSMFKEYNMITPFGLSEYFGFTEDETKELCLRYNVDFNKVKSWYGSYEIEGIKLYYPLSVYRAISDNRFDLYWILTSSIEALTRYMDYDNGKLKGITMKLMIRKKIPLNITIFQNNLTKVESRDQALTMLILLGYLAYDEVSSSCYIPNYEINF